MKGKSTRERTLWLVTTGLLAALVVVGSMIRIAVPSVVGTNAIHLGNIMCILSGILLGPAGGGLAAGIGSALYDMTNPLYIADAWITFLTKGAMGLVAGWVAWWGGAKGLSYKQNLVAALAGSVTYAALYFLKTFAWSGMLVKGLTVQAAALATAAKVPATTFNAVVAIVCAPLLAAAIQKARGVGRKAG